jgi:response regulator RpfG family c-di-GMP phosphodiesterase
MAADETPGGPTVTVVDDEPAALDVLVRAARSWRYECQAARSAEQALELLEQRPTPVVVTDLRMPGRGGVWLVREIQRRWPDMSVIVVTAGTDEHAVTECLNAGAHHYFLKPIKLDEFRHALEVNLRTHVVQRQREGYRRYLEQTVHRQTRRLRRTFLSAIDSLVCTLEARDPYTTGHSLRVRWWALRLAGVLGLEPRQRKLLSLAAKLHDIGKVGVPEAILNKPARLNDEEYRRVKEHPLIGERILRPVIRNREVLAGVRGHHERFDGKGYPDGLQGPDIPELARVIAVVDCFDALTSSRSYREALPMAQALRVIRDGAGTWFDPAIVQAFVTVAPEFRPALRRRAEGSGWQA